MTFHRGEFLGTMALGWEGAELELLWRGKALQAVLFPTRRKVQGAQVWELSRCPGREEVSEELGVVALALLQGRCHGRSCECRV